MKMKINKNYPKSVLVKEIVNNTKNANNKMKNHRFLLKILLKLNNKKNKTAQIIKI